MNILSLSDAAAGLVAYLVAVFVGAGPFAYLAFRLDVFLSEQDEERLIHAGHRSTAIELGTTVLCQAILARHGVYATMAVVRSVFVEELTLAQEGWIFVRSALVLSALISLSIFSIWAAGAVFKRLTRRLNEDEEIRRDNLAMAIFFSFVLLSIAVVLNEGMEDLSRSLIAFGRTGLLR